MSVWKKIKIEDKLRFLNIENRLGELECDNRELKRENRELERENRKLKRENRELECDNRELKRENRELECDNRELKRELKDENMSLVDELEELENKNQSLEDELEELENKNQSLVDELEELRQYLVRNGLLPAATGTYKYHVSRCKTCEHIRTAATFKSHSTGEKYSVKQFMTCKTQNLVYLIQCKRCGQQYVGQTGRALKERVNEHCREIKKKSRGRGGVAEHFCKKGHSIEDLEVMGIEAGLQNKSERRKREKHWIDVLQTVKKGMNKRR